MNTKRISIAVAGTVGALVLTGLTIVAQPQSDEPPEMGFFITSVGLGDGGNLGGLAGADAHCQALAEAAGAGHHTWRAYLSTQGDNAVNARDRIGSGPWANAEGLTIATNNESLHHDNSNITWEHALDENGDQFESRLGGDVLDTRRPMELLPRHPGLHAGESRECRRRGSLLLLCRGVTSG